MLKAAYTRRRFIRLAGGGAALATMLSSGVAHADPHGEDAIWVANHVATTLKGSDGQPVVGLPKWTRLRLMRSFANGQIEVWVPRFDFVGRVPANTIGPVAAPSPGELRGEKLDGPPLY